MTSLTKSWPHRSVVFCLALHVNSVSALTVFMN